MDPNDAMADAGGDAFPRCPLLSVGGVVTPARTLMVELPTSGKQRANRTHRRTRAIQKEVANSYASEIAI